MENLPGDQTSRQQTEPASYQSGYTQNVTQPLGANLRKSLKTFGDLRGYIRGFLQNKKVGFSLIWFFLLLVLLGVTLYPIYSKKPTGVPSPSPTPALPLLTPSPEVSPLASPTPRTGQPVSVPFPTSSPAGIPTSTPVPPTAPPSVQPTPTPRTPNPPIINISYPSEMQSVEMESGQSFCVVDTPAGGDTSGLQRKHNINDEGWSLYTDVFTLCFDPKEGLNRIQFQYKNSFGDESVVYTRQFNFHRIEEISVTISGQIYRDENCNGIRDGGESNIGVSAIVRFFKMPEFSVYGETNSDPSGSFSFSTEIKESESITLQVSVQSPSGYKSNPHYSDPSFTLNSDNRSASVDYPQVPNEFVGQC